ncbi:MAG TPA: hypothetical protein VEN81_11690 [Planctomycetota bacterium]|nr:hypothetical protein [Planctomycetota bacterium]
MATSPSLPSEERVRELTADPKLTPEQANEFGDLFLQAGKHPIAMMFFERSKDASRLEKVKGEAVRAGDAFLLHGVERIKAGLVTEREWRDAGARAMTEGKFLFARDCYEKAGDAERAQAARDAWLKIFPPVPIPPSAQG